MKFFKTSILALLALAATTFTACSDDDDYLAADKTAAPYFASTLPAKVDVPEGQTSFVVTVSRSVEGSEATYTITSTDEDEVFTIPSSVTFAEGATTADLVVACDVDKMGQDVYHPIELSLGDDVASPYGSSSYSARVCIAGPWISLGMCTYTDVYVLGLSYEVELQESQNVPGRYRLVAPYGTAFKDAVELYGYSLSGVGVSSYDENDENFLIVNAEDPEAVYIEEQNLGVSLSGYGEVVAYSYAGYFLDKGYDLATIADAGYAGYVASYQGEENGYVYFDAQNLLVTFEGSSSIYYANSDSGVVLFTFPGVDVRDFSSSISYDGVSTTPNGLVSTASVSVEISDEVDEALFAVSKISSADEDNLNAVLSAMLDGSIETYKLKAGDKKSYDIELEGAGLYVGMVLGYSNVTDKTTGKTTLQLVDVSYKVFNVLEGLGTQANFELMGDGVGYMFDGWMLPMFSVDAEEYGYDIQVYKSKTTPNIFRLYNPYENNIYAAYYNENEMDTAVDIDATDSECICIAPQYSGVTSETLFGGDFYIGNLEGMYYASGNEKEDIAVVMQKKYPKYITTYDEENGIIEVPMPLLGYDADENFGMSYNDSYRQTSVIYLPLEEEGMSLPAKFKKSVARVEHMVARSLGKCTTRVEKMNTLKFKPGKPANLKTSL